MNQSLMVSSYIRGLIDTRNTLIKHKLYKEAKVIDKRIEEQKKLLRAFKNGSA